MLDDELLRAYIDGFYGSGSYQAPYWFIGMEEGGGGSEEGMTRRLDLWVQRGRPELEDLADYHAALGVTKYTGPSAKIQKTWGALIRILMGIQGIPATTEGVRVYQRDRWARHNGEVCIPELLPLPSPRANEWAYSSFSRLPQLKTRKGYRTHYAGGRALHLKSRINEYRPKAVVFYGSENMHWWQEITGAPFQLIRLGKKKVYLASNPNTTFAAINHVTAMGTTNEYLQELGRMIAGSLAGGVGAT